MKKLLRIVLPAFALLFIAVAPQAAFARDGHSSSYSMEHRGDSDWDRDRDHDRGWHNGWRKHCRTVTVKHWNRWQHRMVYTQERVCRR